MYRSGVKPWNSSSWRPSEKHIHEDVPSEVNEVKEEKEFKELEDYKQANVQYALEELGEHGKDIVNVKYRVMDGWQVFLAGLVRLFELEKLQRWVRCSFLFTLPHY